jgi:hypothetical protein
MYVHTYTLLAPEWLHVLYSFFVFESLSILGWWLANLNTLAQKRAFQVGSKQIGNFLENGLDRLD